MYSGNSGWMRDGGGVRDNRIFKALTRVFVTVAFYIFTQPVSIRNFIGNSVDSRLWEVLLFRGMWSTEL